MAIVNSRAAIEPKTGKAAIFVNETIHSLIRKLFANGEVGFAYDPNDLSTMFQDAAGTIPVTAAGQPVGLALDKSRGLEVGPEKVVNGALTSLSGWETLATAPATITAVAGGVSIYSPAGESATLRQAISLKRGDFYKVSFNVKSITGTGYIALYAGTAGVQRYDFNSPGVKNVILQAAPSGDYLLISRSTTCDFTISDISVKELKGIHAYQAVSASRPVLRKNDVTGAYYLGFDGVDDFLQTNNINFTSTDKVSVFAGVRKLSDATAANLVELSTFTGSQNGSFHLRAPSGSGLPNYEWCSRGTIRAFALPPSAYASPISNIISAKGNISEDSTILRVNGVQSASSTADQGTGNFGNYPLYIGRRGGSSDPFNGHLYSLIGIGRLTTDAETKALEKLIAKNTGVTLSV